MTNMKLSIIVITWNAVKFLKETVEPLLASVKPHDCEVIYVINGSKDGTFEYLKSFPQIQIINNEVNRGISIAKNQGAQVAKGEYILMLDDDMLITHRDYTDKLIDYYKSLSNPGIMMPLFIDNEEIEIGATYSYGTYYYAFGINLKHKERVSVDAITRYNKPIPIAISQGGAMFMSKRVWDDLGGFDTSQLFNLDDDDLSTRANVFGYTNYLYNGEPIIHLGLRKRQDKSRYAFNDKTYISGKCKAMLKNFGIGSLLLVFPLSFGKMIAEALYHTVYYKHLPILWANIYSIYVLLKDLPDTLAKRSKIQARRTRPDKEFLWIKSPEYK